MPSRASALGVQATAVLAALATTALPASAWAQEQEVPGQPAAVEAEPPPSTITLDRMDSATRASVQVGLISVDPIEGWFLRSDIHGQYVVRDRGAGFYGQFPMAHFFNPAGPSGTAVGAVDVGVFALPRHNSELVLRFGLAVATGYDAPGSVAAHLFSSPARITDFLLTAPGYTTLRFSASTVQQRDALFFRGDFGLDIVISAPSNASALYLRANAAGGLRTAPGDVTIELVNFGATDSGAGASNSLVHTLTIGMRTRGAHQLHAGLVFPLDGSQRGEVWILSLGYHYTASRSAP